MAKVLLFNPPGPEKKGYTREGRCTQESGIWGTQWPPVSLATAAAFLEEDGHEVRVFDLPATGRGAEFLGEIILAEPPDFVFWSTGTPTLEADLKTARLVRARAPGAVTGVMGTHVSVDPERALGEAELDIVIRREPEAVIRDVCARREGEWSRARGISFREKKGGAIRHNPDAEFLDPRKIPFPAWHKLDIRPYRLPLSGRNFLTVAPVRGCPYPCSFCTGRIYYGKKLRMRPVELVVGEIKADMDRFGISDFFIWADTFTADRSYVQSFCRELMKRGLRASWTCNSRVDTIDRETLKLMRQAGLWMISFGLESGSDRILKSSGKMIQVAQSIEAVREAHELGIRTAGHFILGLPGETGQTMRRTLELALRLPLDIAQFYAAAPFPGTRLYEEALERGWLKARSAVSQGFAALDLPGLTAEKVDGFRRYAYKRFYLRPGALKRMLSILEPGSLLYLLRNLVQFLRWVMS